MNLIRWSPFFEPFDEMDRFLSAVPAQTGFVPSLDIYQDHENLTVETALSGIRPEEVDITIENNVLTIEGRSEKKSEVDEKNYYRKEIRSGAFHRSVALPVPVSGQEAKAEYSEGILKITIPKEEKAKPKSVKIEIKKK